MRQHAGRSAPAAAVVPRKERRQGRRYNPVATRTRLLEAAYALFSQRGYQATGTAEIAAKAGVSEGSIFYHFGSKQALLVELGRYHGHKMVDAMRRDDPEETLTLAVCFERCFDFSSENRMTGQRAGAPQGEGTEETLVKGPEANPFHEGARAVVVEWIRKQIVRQPIANAPYTDPLLTAQLLFSVVGEAMRQYFNPERTDAERRAIRDECIRFCQAATLRG